MVMWRDFYCSVRAARRRSANQERQIKSFAFHLLRDVHHLVEGRRDQPA